MFWALRQLFTPLRYLRIRQGISFFRSKTVYDWILPAVLALIMEVIALRYAPDIKVFTEKGLIGGFQKLLEILVPFYIVALAAVATFERKGLDDEMKGYPALLSIKTANGIYTERVLTRRQFISYLFGYLAMMSLCLFVIVIFCNLAGEKVGEILTHSIGVYALYLKYIVIFLFLLPIWQVLITTLLGVYFLSERLQVMTDQDI